MECIVVVQKPHSEKTIVGQVLATGTGAVNIGACRIPYVNEDDISKTTTAPFLRDVGRKSKEAIGIDKLSFGQVSNAERISYKTSVCKLCL